jgi:hypothetical protein
VLVAVLSRLTAITGMPKAYKEYLAEKNISKEKLRVPEPLAGRDDMNKYVRVVQGSNRYVGKLIKFSHTMAIVKAYTSGDMIVAKPGEVFKLE